MKEKLTPKYYTVLVIGCFLATTLVSLSLLNMGLPTDFRNQPMMFVFILFVSVMLSLSLTSLFAYKVVKLPVHFDLKLLESGEQVLVDSNLYTVFSKGRFGVGLWKNYITITNKRIVVAANNFGFWSYKYLVRSYWFQDRKSKQKAELIRAIELTQKKDGIKILDRLNEWVIYTDDAERIMSILQSQ